MTLQEEIVTRDVPEHITDGAKDGRDWFIAYMREGFTEEQALALVTRSMAVVNIADKKPWYRR